MGLMRAAAVVAITLSVAVSVAARDATVQASHVCPTCQWQAPRTKRTVTVRSVDDLVYAVQDLRPSTTLLLEDGEYRLRTMLDIPVPDVVLRSKSGDRTRVVIRGAGLTEQHVGVALSISSPRVTVADLTVGYVAYHTVQVRGESGASNFMLHNVRLVDAGQQLFKVTLSKAQQADDGVVACSLMEYTDHAPSSYTNGVDALGAKGWVVRDNRFVRIRGPKAGNYNAGPAVMFWANSIDTVVERNLIVDSYRGIALGLLPEAQDLARAGEKRVDHQGGVVRNNVICNLHPWADEGIEANGASDVQIDHNTVLVEGSLSWSISARFRNTTALVRNNITSRQILLRDGGRAEMEGNVAGALPSWFQSAPACDLHLTDQAGSAVEAAVPLTHVADDFDRTPRSGPRRTAGAFERAPRQR